MKLTLLQENLIQTLSVLTKALPSKPSLPILASIKLSADTAICTAQATDLYFGVDTSIAANVVQPGTAIVPGKQFKEVIASLSPGPLTLSFSDGTLLIESGKSKTTLQCQAADEYPPFPEVVGKSITLKTTALQAIDTLVGFAASTDVARPVLTSILFQATDGKTRVVATDGFRLAVLDILSGISLDAEIQLLLPAKAISEVVRLAIQRNVDEVHLVVSEELKQVKFSVAEVLVYVRLIEGQYPPYEKIIPSEFLSTVTFDAQELQTHCKRAQVFARESSNIIRFSCGPESVSVSATSNLVGTYQGVLEQAIFTGESMEIAFNAKYVQELLSALTTTTLQMRLLESLKPVSFTCAEVPGYTYIVMPFKVAA